MKDENDDLLKAIDLPGRKVPHIYELNVGRVKFYLLHTNIPDNDPTTDNLRIACISAILNCEFPGDPFGDGGVALRALGYDQQPGI